MVLKAKANPPQPPTRNKFEQRYIKEVLEQAKDIERWYYEPLRFYIAPRTTYTPDFMVVKKKGTIEFHETKGSWRAKGAQVTRVKLKTCAELYPMFDWFGVTFRKGKWVWEKINP